MIKKRKKNTRFRGSKTHGYGSMKKHRGSGHQGGVGNAGSGKRADCKKPTFLKMGRVFGKHGFKSKSRTITTSVNLRYIEEKADYLIKSGKAAESGGVISINIADIGCDKLLGKGNVSRKYNIQCLTATAGAIEAVKKAGGSITVKETAEKKIAKGKANAAEEGKKKKEKAAENADEA